MGFLIPAELSRSGLRGVRPASERRRSAWTRAHSIGALCSGFPLLDGVHGIQHPFASPRKRTDFSNRLGNTFV